jgi:hypothetical protein
VSVRRLIFDRADVTLSASTVAGSSSYSRLSNLDARRAELADTATRIDQRTVGKRRVMPVPRNAVIRESAEFRVHIQLVVCVPLQGAASRVADGRRNNLQPGTIEIDSSAFVEAAVVRGLAKSLVAR